MADWEYFLIFFVYVPFAGYLVVVRFVKREWVKPLINAHPG